VDKQGVLRGLITIKTSSSGASIPDATRTSTAPARGGRCGRHRRGASRAKALLDAGADVIVIDSAHGAFQGRARRRGAVARGFPDAQLVAGNVATHGRAQALVGAPA